MSWVALVDEVTGVLNERTMTEQELGNQGLDSEANDSPRALQKATVARFHQTDSLSLRKSEDSTVEATAKLEAGTHPDFCRQESIDEKSLRTYVDFSPGDPANPLNFSVTRKWCNTVLAVVMSILVAISTGSYVSVIPNLIAEFGVSMELATSGISLYVLGCMIPQFLVCV